MSRFAIFVDAGYFYAAGAATIHGENTGRRNISINSTHDLVRALIDRASSQCSNSALLRIYWYDALQSPRMSMEQTALAREAGIKVRLGTLNHAGEQKGVDSLIVTDLIELARNKAIVDAVLLSGDEDLRIAVQVAQSFGVRVHILSIGSPEHSVSPSLQMEADSVQSLDREWLVPHLSVKAAAKASATPKADITAVASVTETPVPQLLDAANAACAQILDRVCAEDIELLEKHFRVQKVVPPEYDRKLIAKTSAFLARQLESQEKRQIRGAFVIAVRDRSPKK